MPDSSVNAGKSTGVPQFEVTPEMIEAGLAVFDELLVGDDALSAGDIRSLFPKALAAAIAAGAIGETQSGGRRALELVNDVPDDPRKLCHQGDDFEPSRFFIRGLHPTPKDIVCLYHRSLLRPPAIGDDEYGLPVVIDDGGPLLKLVASPLISAGDAGREIEDGGAEDGD